MTRKLKHVDLCPSCILDGGWDSRNPDDLKRCDHGQTAAVVSAAIVEDLQPHRFCPSCDDGYGPCRCPS